MTSMQRLCVYSMTDDVSVEEYRLWEIDREPVSGLKLDDVTVAWANSLQEITHYASMYSQDGPVKIEKNVGGKWVKVILETVTK